MRDFELVPNGVRDPYSCDTHTESQSLVCFADSFFKMIGIPRFARDKLKRISIIVWMSALCIALLSCSKPPDPNTLVMIIESSPANLDPRIGVEAQSERIDELMFDSLVRKDEHFDLKPWAAERWETPDSQTYIFHIRHGIQFHDGRPLTAKDVKWTLDSMRDGSLATPKGAAYQFVDKTEIKDDFTLLVHLREPDATLLWNLSDGAFGIVPYGSDKDFNRKPIGSGPFRFVRHDLDSQVILERNNHYWAARPKVERVRFAVVPDTTTRALELRKGSADIAINAMPMDMVRALRQDRDLQVMERPGTILVYLGFNLRDPILKDVRVRKALAFAIDRQPMLHYIFGDAGRLADSVLPPEQWAHNGDVAHYPYNPDKANSLLDSAGYPRQKDGVRFHLTMKTSQDETTRLMAVVLQQQLKQVGIALDIRSFETATFLADVVKGVFQLYSLRLIGGNQDPDIFEGFFHSNSFPPKRYNRGRYSNPRVDQLIDEGRGTLDQQRRKQIYAEIQQILADELPFINFWYLDNVLVHSSRVSDLNVGPSGNYDFLVDAKLRSN